MDPASLDALYRQWINRLWNGDLAIVPTIVAPDFVGHWPDRDIHGPGELAAVIEETRAMFTEMTFTIAVGPVAQEELVAGRWVGHAVTPSGERVVFTGNDILRAVGGRFVEYWTASSAGTPSDEAPETG